MSAGDIYLGVSGSEILLSRAGLRLKIVPTEIIVKTRTADGTQVSDLKAKKQHVDIAYDPAITGTNLDSLLALYDLDQELSMIIDREDGATDTYTVTLNPIERERALVRDIWLWSGVTLSLDEV